jgi:hypothetical protein
MVSLQDVPLPGCHPVIDDKKIARSFPQNLSSPNICFFPWVFPKNLQVELISCTCHGQGLALFVVAWALFLWYSIGDAASKVGGSTTV